jgi:hypothetical protein
VDVVQNIVVPEAQDSVALRLQEASSSRIIFGRSRMLATINFNDEPFGKARKISEVWADR